MSNPRKIIAVTAVLVLLASAGWWLFGREPEPAVWRQPVALDGRYEARYELTLDGRVPGTGRRSAHVAVRGKLDVGPAASDDGARWFAARLTVDSLDADEAAKRVTDFGVEGASAHLASAWMFRLDEEGRVGEVRFSDDTPVSVRGVFSALASSAQLARPKGTSNGSWEADETEINGPYRARYEASGATIAKTWAVRTAGNPDDPTKANSYEADGEAKFATAAAWIEHVTVSQRGSAAVGGNTREDRARFDTAIELARTGDTPSGWASAYAPSAFVPFSVAQVVPRKMGAEPGETFDSLVETARVAGEKHDWQKRVLARNDLTRLVADDDRLAERTAKMIRAGGLSEPMERTFLETLVGASTPAAQGEVAAMIGDRKLNRETRVRVLQATSLMTRPGHEVMKALDGAAFSAGDAIYASQAAMVLGAAAQHLQDNEPAVAQHTTQALLKRAGTVVIGPAKPGKPVASLAERTNWIGALGNAGAPESLPILLGLLKDPDATIRASAAHSLRFMDPAQALQAMEIAMREDKSITVRHALLHAARTMGPEKMEAFVTKVLMYDESEHVRLGAAYCVAFWAIKAPGLRRTLADALAREKSPKVQESLRNYLEPGRVAPPFRLIPDTGDGQ